MELSKEQQELYQKTMKEIEKQLASIDEYIEEEIRKLKERLKEVQEKKKALRRTYLGLAKLLGAEIEDEEEEEKNIHEEVKYNQKQA